MSTKLPLLYSMFGLAGTGGERDPSCKATSWSMFFFSVNIWQEEVRLVVVLQALEVGGGCGGALLDVQGEPTEEAG